MSYANLRGQDRGRKFNEASLRILGLQRIGEYVDKDIINCLNRLFFGKQGEFTTLSSLIPSFVSFIYHFKYRINLVVNSLSFFMFSIKFYIFLSHFRPPWPSTQPGKLIHHRAGKISLFNKFHKIPQQSHL